jgi:hypothetical protein
MVKLDVRRERVIGVLDLPDGRSGMPQDVKLSPDGRVFYVADMHANGRIAFSRLARSAKSFGWSSLRWRIEK